MSAFSHLDNQGEARMVDVTSKPAQRREATAAGSILCQAETLRLLREQALPKGDVLAVARIAGIQAAKRTHELIPLCHALSLDQVSIRFDVHEEEIAIAATVRTTAKTGVEMEALTAVTVAALTLYDMMKAVDKTMRINAIRVTEKIKA